MDFTFDAYKRMISLLSDCGYAISDYEHYTSREKVCILRHDVDMDLKKAAAFAELEAGLLDGKGIRSTYFVLMNTDMYNTYSSSSRELLHRIQDCGHDIGLHFDEAAYRLNGDPELIVGTIERERDALEDILGARVTAVSMHRPSRATLEMDLQLPDMINSYGSEFFHGFKYISDSRMSWCEQPEEIIAAGAHMRLHILTHPIWYSEQPRTMAQCLGSFVRAAAAERYDSLEDNFTSLSEVIRKENIIL